jgi:two-component system, sensor histidine kinase PdtaS
MRLYATIAILLFLTYPALAQTGVPDSPRYLFPLLTKSRPDTNRVALLNRLAGYYIFKPGNEKRDMDSAMGYLDTALLLSRQLNTPDWVNATLMLQGDCYLEADGPRDLVKGGNCFIQVAEYYRRKGDALSQARTWTRYAECLVAYHYQQKARCLTTALAIYKLLPGKDRLEATKTLKTLADTHLMQGRIDSAVAELLEVIAQYKSIGYRRLQYSYDLLAQAYLLQGFPQKYLQCRFQCVQSMYESGDTSHAVTFICKLGIAYYRLGFNDQAISSFDKVLNHSLVTGEDRNYYYYTLANIAGLLSKTGRGEQSVRLLNEATKAGLPVIPSCLAWVFLAYAESYKALGQFARSEKQYLDLFRLLNTQDLVGYTGRKRWTDQLLSFMDLYLKMGRLDKARSLMRKIGIIPFAALPADVLGGYYFAKFKLDSAAGNFTAAIRNYTLYKQLNDSVFNATKNRQVQELEISYETKQKEESIKDLQSKGKVRQAELTKSNAQKRLILIGSGLLLVIAILAFVGFRQKQRSNRLLQAHQKEIDEKNLSLESLNHRQGLLLKEKEWLVREIHHRVKNNLQTTISLLHMQSAYLTNEQALTALRNSQHRLQAMSLIHQRLYQSEDMTSIEMSSYITELVTFLKESYRGIDNISFDFRIDPVVFDISLAIPLGLIINEAITNAIKYAFPNDRSGKVSVSLHATAGENYMLIIVDNGIGLSSSNPPPGCKGSLGLDLIRGLTDQVQGEVQIEGHDGTRVTIIFNAASIFITETAAKPMSI